MGITDATEFITLKDGPTLPAAALQLAVDLEMRGFTLRIDGEKLRVTVADGAETLTPADRDAITKWKSHLMAIVEYCAREIPAP